MNWELHPPARNNSYTVYHTLKTHQSVANMTFAVGAGLESHTASSVIVNVSEVSLRPLLPLF